jgi:hypothetical protein
MCRDIAINIGSDFLFIGLITLLLWLLSPREVEKAHRFFGFRKQSEIKIYISGFSHPGVRTQKVVTALEYEVAVEKKGTLAQLPGTGFVRRLREYVANLIGQDLRYPEPDIEISPLGKITGSPNQRSIILIGGPVSNQISSHYLEQPSVRFRYKGDTYQKRTNGGYKDLGSGNVAILEKMKLEEQVLILAHGSGEEQTARAVRYLVQNWKSLYKQYGEEEFAICSLNGQEFTADS